MIVAIIVTSLFAGAWLSGLLDRLLCPKHPVLMDRENLDVVLREAKQWKALDSGVRQIALQHLPVLDEMNLSTMALVYAAFDKKNAVIAEMKREAAKMRREAAKIACPTDYDPKKDAAAIAALKGSGVLLTEQQLQSNVRAAAFLADCTKKVA